MTTISQLSITRYFKLLGYQKDEPVVLRALPGKGYKRAGGISYIPSSITRLPWDKLQSLTAKDTPYALYAVVNGGGHSDSEVSQGKAFFFEWDDISKEQQWERVRELGLAPFITFTVETRKSIHFYIVLDTPCTTDQWSQLQRDLLAFTDSDQALKNLSRVMRPAGTLHIQKDCEPFLCCITYEAPVRTKLEILRAFIPASANRPSTSRRGKTSKRTSTGTTIEALEQKASQHQYSKQLSSQQIEQVLVAAKEKLTTAEPGNRNHALFTIGCDLGRQLVQGVPVKDAFSILCDGAAASGLEPDEYEPTALRALDTGVENAIESHPNTISDKLAKASVIDSPDQNINQRYISELPFGGRQHLILKSQKGTGKTTALKSHMQQLHESGTKAILIGHRCVLLSQSSANLDLSYYDDVVGKLDSQDYLAITLDSLHRIDPSAWKGCVVLLDEASQVLHHLTGDTAVKKTRLACLETLRFLITNSTHTVMLDADMSSLEVDFLSRLVPRETINVVVNTQPPAKRKFIQHHSRESLVNYIIEQLEQGKNIYAPSNSKELVDEVTSIIQQRIPSIELKVVTSENSGTAEIQMFVRDINEQVKTVRCLFASPSLGTGVDINVSHFDVVCALMTNGSQCSASDIMQHIARVRDIRSNTVHFWVRGGLNRQETDVERIKEEVTYETHHDLYSINRKTGKREPVDRELHDLYVWLYCSVTARHNASVLNLKRSVLKLIEAEGHDLEQYDVPANEEAEAQTKAQLKETRAQLKREAIEAIVNAPALDEQQVESIKNERHIAPKQQASIDHYYLRRDCGISTEEVTAEWAEWYSDKGRRGIRKYMNTFIKTVKLLDERDKRERLDDGTFAPDQSKAAAESKLRRLLIPDNILKGEEFSHDSLHTSGWVELAQQNAEAIKALLGITFNAAKPVQAMTSLLSQVGLDVTSRETKTRSTLQVSPEKDSTYIRDVTETSGDKTKKRRKNIRLYSVTHESIDRMNGIVERTRSRLAWEWYETAMKQKYRLENHAESSDSPLTPEIAERIANLGAAMAELLPLVQEKLDEIGQWDDDF